MENRWPWITFFLPMIISIEPKHGSSFDNETLKHPTTPWYGHEFVFVGGYHHSGTSVTERLLSTQSWATGFDIIKVNQPQCLKQNCNSPEREGLFLTQAFTPQRGFLSTHPCTSVESGECGEAKSKEANRFLIEASPERLNEMRNELWRDWSKFWRDCKKKPNSRYLIEKDIPNMYRSRLLQRLFGEQTTSFVFVMRHPLARCFKSYKESNPTACKTHLRAWLKGHDVLFNDVIKLKNVIIFQLEKLVSSPQIILKSIGSLLSTDLSKSPLSFQYINDNFYDLNDDKNEKIFSIERRKLGIYPNSISQGSSQPIIHISKKDQHYITKYDNLFKNKKSLRAMYSYYEKSVQEYCYSIYTLEPINSNYSKYSSHCDSDLVLFHKNDLKLNFENKLQKYQNNFKISSSFSFDSEGVYYNEEEELFEENRKLSSNQFLKNVTSSSKKGFGKEPQQLYCNWSIQLINQSEMNNTNKTLPTHHQHQHSNVHHHLHPNVHKKERHDSKLWGQS